MDGPCEFQLKSPSSRQSIDRTLKAAERVLRTVRPVSDIDEIVEEIESTNTVHDLEIFRDPPTWFYSIAPARLCLYQNPADLPIRSSSTP